MPLATILIEDSPIIREGLIPALVELADANIIAVADTATDGILALEAHENRWQLAVVDLFLKSGNGLDVLRAAKGRRRDQRILILTNYATADVRRRAMEAGADGVFDKSTELDRFLELCSSYTIT